MCLNTKMCFLYLKIIFLIIIDLIVSIHHHTSFHLNSYSIRSRFLDFFLIKESSLLLSIPLSLLFYLLGLFLNFYLSDHQLDPQLCSCYFLLHMLTSKKFLETFFLLILFFYSSLVNKCNKFLFSSEYTKSIVQMFIILCVIFISAQSAVCFLTLVFSLIFRLSVINDSLFCKFKHNQLGLVQVVFIGLVCRYV